MSFEKEIKISTNLDFNEHLAFPSSLLPFRLKSVSFIHSIAIKHLSGESSYLLISVTIGMMVSKSATNITDYICSIEA